LDASRPYLKSYAAFHRFCASPPSSSHRLRRVLRISCFPTSQTCPPHLIILHDFTHVDPECLLPLPHGDGDGKEGPLPSEISSRCLNVLQYTDCRAIADRLSLMLLLARCSQDQFCTRAPPCGHRINSRPPFGTKVTIDSGRTRECSQIS
jgi:hypothetical protein